MFFFLIKNEFEPKQNKNKNCLNFASILYNLTLNLQHIYLID